MLTREWRQRIESWKSELYQHFYKPLGSIALKGFVTGEQLSAAEAAGTADSKFIPMPPGTPWGGKWEYGWFKGEVTLPEGIKNRRTVLRIDPGAEAIIFINGQAVGSNDKNHQYITIQGLPGDSFYILAEAYAGHGPRVAHLGPVPPGRVAVPEPGPAQAEVGESSYGLWNEEAYQLWLDVETLFQIRENLAEDSLRKSRIDQGLRDFTLTVDFEAAEEEMLRTCQECRRLLRPLMECVNGSTVPTMFAFGHAHLDIAWKWPLRETDRKIARTFSNQLALMEEYPEYKYLQSQPYLYQVLREKYPELYQRVKEAVNREQVIPDGGMWVEADTNITGGESLIRQLIHGKKFYREEFGVESKFLWLPDVFGYSGALPQIMRGCGIDYFASAKIFRAYYGRASFPYNTFFWVGIDGSEIPVHICNKYNTTTDPGTIIKERWGKRVQDGISTFLLPFGHGDGGGGATRNHLEFIRRTENLEGTPKVKLETPVEFFRDLEAKGELQDRYVGEIYYQVHQGTYTSQSRTKKGNRKSEFSLREAEFWSSIAAQKAEFDYPVFRLEQAWKRVLLNQFHDILPGSSIRRVYEEAESDYRFVEKTTAEIITQATQSLVEGESCDDRTVFNSLPWERKVLVELPGEYQGAVDVDGKELPLQDIEGRRYTEINLPSCGWTTISSSPLKKAVGEDKIEETPRVTAFKDQEGNVLLKNRLIEIKINSLGEITGIYDLEGEREWAVSNCNSFQMYQDIPFRNDAWDINSMYTARPVKLGGEAQIEVITAGPLAAVVRVRRKLHNSHLVQDIYLRQGKRRIDFKTWIDWQESHKLLKVAFPVNIQTDKALHEIQFGHIERPNHDSRPYDADRYEVCNHKWTAIMEGACGAALLNDCKYGINVIGNSMNLTLLKAPLAPDMYADKGEHQFIYSLYLWNGSFLENDLIEEAYDLNVSQIVTAGYGGRGSLFAFDRQNIVMETVKLAEDGSGDLVLRLYESKNTSTRCLLKTTLPVCRSIETDMLEEERNELAIENGQINLDFRPFEIKTVRLKMQ